VTISTDEFEKSIAAAELNPTGDLFGPRSSWTPRTVYHEGELPPPPTPEILTTRQGSSLLLPATTNLLFGASTVGKSWIALHAAVQELNKGNRVLWIDYEWTLDKLRGRLVALDVPRDRWGLLDYIRPEDRLTITGGTSEFYGRDFRPVVNEHRYSFAVVDALTPALSQEGLDPNVGTDVETIYRVLGRTLTDTGTSVLFIDHEGKGKERDKRYSIGSERKLTGLTGVSLRAEGKSKVSRATYETLRGETHLIVAKDREGYLTTGGGDQERVAVVEFIARPDGTFAVNVDHALDVEVTPPTWLLTEVVRAVRSCPGGSGREIGQIARGNATDSGVREALRWLVDKGYARQEPGARNSRRYYLNESRVETLKL
jgi:hypothetical protein